MHTVAARNPWLPGTRGGGVSLCLTACCADVCQLPEWVHWLAGSAAVAVLAVLRAVSALSQLLGSKWWCFWWGARTCPTWVVMVIQQQVVRWRTGGVSDRWLARPARLTLGQLCSRLQVAVLIRV